jgi:RNA polymerase sigma-70 factor (ECF subfamily)
MAEENAFRSLMQRVRAGDQAAASELVHTYEPYIRRAVRIHLTDSRLKRLIDSMDICQSVLASFFVRAALGQYQVDTPEQLLRLLKTMARNKLLNQAARQRTLRRDPRHGEGLRQKMKEPATPSEIATGRELIARVREGFTEEERQLADLRAAGREWAEIAAERGGSPEALRKKLARAIDRVAHQLGLDAATEH